MLLFCARLLTTSKPAVIRLLSDFLTASHRTTRSLDECQLMYANLVGFTSKLSHNADDAVDRLEWDMKEMKAELVKMSEKFQKVTDDHHKEIQKLKKDADDFKEFKGILFGRQIALSASFFLRQRHNVKLVDGKLPGPTPTSVKGWLRQQGSV